MSVCEMCVHVCGSQRTGAGVTFWGIICFIFTYPGPLNGPELTAWAKLSSQQILRILLLLPPQYEAHKVTSPVLAVYMALGI